MKKIVFASWNSKKAAEIQRIAPEGIKILCLTDIPEIANVPQADETANTFLGNAVIKARYWHDKLNLPVLAEDSGIEIAALNGYPGVYTKRCIEQLRPGSNVNVDPAQLYPLLLELMAESGSADTSACWCSAMAYVESKKAFVEPTLYTEQYLHGDMCSCAGEHEFGFDQYFRAKGFDKTLAELSPIEKDMISPRSKALEQIFKLIKETLTTP